jgi:hypothetical protein
MLPRHDELETSSYSLSGSGQVHFDLVAEPATSDTTYANRPEKVYHLNDFPLAPGTTYWVGDHRPCPAGASIGVEMSADGLDLNYFQDWNPKPIGLYLRAC